MVAIAGEMLNLELQELKLVRNLKVNRVTTTLNVAAGSNGPFTLPADYLRTYDMFYPLQTPSGMTQLLNPITMEQYDEEWKGVQVANYPYEYATDLSTDAIAATSIVVPGDQVASVNILDPGLGYWTPPLLAFGGPGAGAAAGAFLGLQAFLFIIAGGAGYTVGDVLTPVGGIFTTPGTLRVMQAVAGAVFTLDVLTPGAYIAVPGVQNSGFGVKFTDLVPLSGGTGVGATAALVWGVFDAVMASGGAGYTAAPTVTGSLGGPPSIPAVFTSSLTVGGTTPGAGQLYIYPQSLGALPITHRYMKNQPDIVNPSTSTEVPWFPNQSYLVKKTATMMMGISGDARYDSWLAQSEEMLRPYLIQQGDEQQTVQSIRLDPRHFKTPRGVRPTKDNPY